MPRGRVELPPLTGHGPKPCASANSATAAGKLNYYIAFAMK